MKSDENPMLERLAGGYTPLTRRALLSGTLGAAGSTALAALLAEDAFAAPPSRAKLPAAPALTLPGKAKRMIVLWQGGAPSHVDLFDHKPHLAAMRGQELPASVRSKVRLSTMTASAARHPILPALKPFVANGKSGTMLSPLLPHIGSIADKICLVNSMTTDAVNHAPGVTLFLTGSQIPGRPSFGSWMVYGLGRMTEDLPAFVVMTSTDVGRTCGQLFFDYYWGSGFLPSEHQGTRFRSEGEPVLYLGNPDGVSSGVRRATLDGIQAINRRHAAAKGDPEISSRISQYETAFRMQTSVPDLLAVEKEPQHILDLYGSDVHRPGSFARHCLLARRLVERGTRFVQLMHSGWDQHGNLSTQLAEQCRDTDQPAAALVKDLEQRGLLDDTIVLWMSEFGRTVFGQGDINASAGYGRDHLGSVYSIWAAGGGFKPGTVYGASDDFAYNVAKDPVHVHDLQATILALFGIEHTKFTYRYQGRDFRLTDVYGDVVKGLMA
jgi:hypothetical protein